MRHRCINYWIMMIVKRDNLDCWCILIQNSIHHWSPHPITSGATEKSAAYINKMNINDHVSLSWSAFVNTLSLWLQAEMKWGQKSQPMHGMDCRATNDKGWNISGSEKLLNLATLDRLIWTYFHAWCKTVFGWMNNTHKTDQYHFEVQRKELTE